MHRKATAAVFFVLCCAWQVHSQSVNCTAAGRFAVASDTTCRNYTLCVYSSSSGSYLSYNYVCPSTSVFNPNSRVCTAPANYACNVTVSSDTPVSLCTSEGLIPDPSSTDCANYIECVQDGDTYIETMYPCPAGTYFNPVSTNCEFDYDCAAAFSCTAAGRFADATDCGSYFFCVLNSDGSFIQHKYTCPSSSLFNPISQICSSKYTCPK